MSFRSLIEFNHDRTPDKAEDLKEWSEAMQRYFRSGMPNCLPRGATFFRMRHHSADCALGNPPRGWSNDEPLHDEEPIEDREFITAQWQNHVRNLVVDACIKAGIEDASSIDGSGSDGTAFDLTEAEIQIGLNKLLDRIAEYEALMELIPSEHRIQCREGGGHEDKAASLALSISRMTSQLEKQNGR